MKDVLNMFQTTKPAFRQPEASDGPEIWELVRNCKPLDENSMYCNLLQCDHFSDTCVVAELDGEIVGWVSGYVVPDEPETVFVWQVAVDASARGMGLGKRMLDALLDRPACEDVTRLKTTITRDNAASWALFRKLARSYGGSLSSEAHFTRDEHFRDSQKTEHMVTIDLDERAQQAA